MNLNLKSYLKWVTEKLSLTESDERVSQRETEKEIERQNALKSALKQNVYNKIPVRISTHAASQAKVRRSDLERNDWDIILDRVTKKISELPNGEYLVYSKSYEEGIVIDWNSYRVLIMTVLPKARQNPKPGTIKTFVESEQKFSSNQILMVD